MPPDADPIDGPVDRLSGIERTLAEIAERLAYQGIRPEDPEEARRWETPIYWHISVLRDSMHALRNHTQILRGLIEQFGRKLDRNAQISLENRDAIARLTEISRKIEASAAQIEQAASVVVREKPLLLRDLYWCDTNPVEIGLILYTAGEAMIFLIKSDALLRSAMFRAMAMLCGNPGLWGIGCGLLALGSAIAFATRSRRWRVAAVFALSLYFGITGTLPLFLTSDVLGWLPHLLAFFGSAWVLSRGPSGAI